MSVWSFIAKYIEGKRTIFCPLNLVLFILKNIWYAGIILGVQFIN